MNQVPTELLKKLPKVDRLLETDEAKQLIGSFSRRAVVSQVREGLDTIREQVLTGSLSDFTFSPGAFFGEVEERLHRKTRPRLRPVINATGIAIHTNLGRSPLAEEALRNLAETARGYSNLEFDLETGKRGSRYDHIEELLCELTGAQGAVVVNNNAAAVMLVLKALAEGGEVIVSRGELIEIGGSFRIPDVIANSNAKLVEVGATNKTRIQDYEKAITESTRILMKVHPSNYRIVGFTAETAREDLVALAQEHDLIAVEDLGSGALIDLQRYGLPHETTIHEVIKSGMHIVTFSGDKLLGGPQAGIILGKTPYISAMKKHPLIRALRIDKLSLAALEATLHLYQDEDRLEETLPLLRQLCQSPDALVAKAAMLRDLLADTSDLTAEVLDGESFSGGGSLPNEGIPTKVVAIRHESVNASDLIVALRANNPPVIARVADDALVVDVRTVTEEEIPVVAKAILSIAS